MKMYRYIFGTNIPQLYSESQAWQRGWRAHEPEIKTQPWSLI